MFDAVAHPRGIYILRSRRNGLPFFVGASLDLPHRLAEQLRADSTLLRAAGLDPDEVIVECLEMPNSDLATLALTETLLVSGFGRQCEGTGPLLNRAREVARPLAPPQRRAKRARAELQQSS